MKKKNTYQKLQSQAFWVQRHRFSLESERAVSETLKGTLHCSTIALCLVYWGRARLLGKVIFSLAHYWCFHPSTPSDVIRLGDISQLPSSCTVCRSPTAFLVFTGSQCIVFISRMKHFSPSQLWHSDFLPALFWHCGISHVSEQAECYSSLLLKWCTQPFNTASVL